MLRVFRQAVGDNASLSWTWCALAMGFPICLSRKRPSHGLGVSLRWVFPSACRGKGLLMDLVRACDGLFLLSVEEKAVLWTWCALAMGFPPLSVEEKADSWTWRALAMGFSPCLSRKRQSWEHDVRLRFPFPPACRGKGRLMDMACACDSLSPLPVEEKAIMGTWRALAIPFSPCLSRKRQSWEHGVRLRLPFHPACRGKGNHGNMACARDSLFSLPVEEKAIMGTWRALAMAFYPLPVEEKAIMVTWRALAIPFLP